MQEELAEGEEIARCPSCSLYITVVYDPVSVVAAPTMFNLLPNCPHLACLESWQAVSLIIRIAYVQEDFQDQEPPSVQPGAAPIVVA